MPTETDIRIARAVALKASVDLVNSKAILLADLEGRAEEFAGWLLSAPAQPTSIHGDPGPDVPYDDSEALAPGGFVSRGPAAPRCGTGPEDAQGCGTEMVYWSGTNKEGVDYAGWKCPNQKKSRDPAEQAAEKVRHPVQWIN